MRLKNYPQVNQVLFVLIALGTVFRFLYPFFSNPLDHLYSDPNRHLASVLPQNFGIDLFSILDPPLPQIILLGALALFGNTVFGAATYFGLLCAITPWCWYLWARLVFSSKTTALIFIAIITYLPSWIGICSLFMDEPLLLPLLGLSLWLSWRAKRKNTPASLILAAIVWSLTLSVKLTVAFELVIIMSWLFISFLKPRLSGKKILTTLLVIGILATSYIVYPLWVYKGLGFTWLFPPGTSALNRGWYMSNAVEYSANVVYRGKTLYQTGSFGSNGTCSEPFSPFSNWSTWRKGLYNYEINCQQPLTLILPCQSLAWKDRLRNMTEEALHFFFSASWPDSRTDDPVQLGQVYMRWIWSVLSLAIIILTIYKKQFKNILVVLCLGTLAFYLLSNCSMIDGRYRKPWEGIAIATFLYLCTMPRQISEQKKRITDQAGTIS